MCSSHLRREYLGFESFPDEILCHIFEMLPSRIIYFRLLHVCRRFKDVILQYMPSLKLNLTHRDNEDLYLERSLQQLPDLTSVTYVDHCSWSSNLLHFLFRYCTKIRYMCLKCKTTVEFNKLFELFLSNCIGLHKLLLTSKIDASFVRGLTRYSSTTLTFLSIRTECGEALKEITNLRALTNLSLDIRCKDTYKFEVLASLEYLLHFKINCTYDHLHSTTNGDSQYLTYYNYNSLLKLFASDCFANVETLSLTVGFFIASSKILKLLEILSNIKYLELYSNEYSEDQLHQILLSNYNLQYIDIEDCLLYNGDSLLNIKNTNPFLTHISLRHHRHLADEYFLKLTELNSNLTVRRTERKGGYLCKEFQRTTYIEHGCCTVQETRRWRKGRERMEEFFDMM